MSINLLEKFKAALPGWKERMKQSGAKSAYAVITASALWPLVAAAQAGDTAGAAALASALGAGVATKLFADQILKWNNEADGARQIAELPKDDAVREPLDKLLQRLEAFRAAHDALPDADKQWFLQRIREELHLLGNLDKFEGQLTAIQSGSGGQAVGQKNVVAGERGIAVGGDFQGNVTIT